MSKWISIDDRLPRHKQHVIVCNDRFNVKNGEGDDEHGRVRMGDAFFYSGDVMWDEKGSEQSSWESKEAYARINGWHEWSGQGPCSFSEVTHWMPMPEMPEEKDYSSEGWEIASQGEIIQEMPQWYMDVVSRCVEQTLIEFGVKEIV